MTNGDFFEHDTELQPVSLDDQSAHRLIQSRSEGISERESDRKLSSDQAALNPKRSTPSRRSRARFEGWKFTIFLAFITSVIVLCFNVGFVLYTVTHPREDDVGRYPVEYQLEYHQLGKHRGRNTILYEGDCENVHRASIGIHLLVNLLSTALLSASNYGMQCLAAPTRQAIDRAHQKSRWLDIGVPSMRNLFRVSKWRSLLWICLASSSLPFHLIYNSAIYQTTSVPAYDIFAGSETLAQKNWPDVNLTGHAMNSSRAHSLRDLFDAARNETLTHLDNNDCLVAFGKTYQSTYSKLLLVNTAMRDNNSYTFVYTVGVFNPYEYLRDPHSSPYEWLCPSNWNTWEMDCGSSYLPNVRNDIANDNWKVRDLVYKVDSCLAKKAPQYCKLQYSLPLTLVVIGCNIVKSAVLLYIWLGINKAPILTVGDAISSFLRRPDPHTQGYCLVSYKMVREWDEIQPKTSKPRVYLEERKRWGSAVSIARWISSILLWGHSIIISALLLIYGLGSIGAGVDIWKQELGAIVADTLIKGDHWPNTLLPNVLIANAPQLIYSFIYFAFNSMLTAMTLAAEWSSYAVNHKGLRVSNDPLLSQRSNYFLSIPYRYAIPLAGLSGILHWLISQSLFMVGIEAFDTDMIRNPKRDIITCGFSPVAIVISIAIGVFMFLCLWGLSLRRFVSAMPVAGSSSFAISAACHPTFVPGCRGEGGEADGVDSELEDEDMALLPVRWGAVSNARPTGHCSFTSGDVDEPEKGREYQ